jgi:hypothetical protein
LAVSALAGPARNVVAMTASAVELKKVRKRPPRGQSPSQKPIVPSEMTADV